MEEIDDDNCVKCGDDRAEHDTAVGWVCSDCLSDVVDELAERLAAANDEIAKLRAAWPGLFGFGRVWRSGDNWEIYTQTGWIKRGKTRDEAINAACGIEEPRT